MPSLDVMLFGGRDTRRERRKTVVDAVAAQEREFAWQAIVVQAEALRTEQLERIKIQHQLVVVAGALAGVSVTVLLRPGAQVSPELLLGLSVLFWAIGLAMLNQELFILASAAYLSNPDELGELGSRWRHWEQALKTQYRRHGPLNILPAVAQYAVPVFSALGSTAAFVLTTDGDARYWVAVPASTALLFFGTSFGTFRRYARLSG